MKNLSIEEIVAKGQRLTEKQQLAMLELPTVAELTPDAVEKLKKYSLEHNLCNEAD